MNRQLLDAWITDHDHANTLTIESMHTDERRISTRELTFPDRDTKQPRHTIVISFLSDQDLLHIRRVIDNYLFGDPL